MTHEKAVEKKAVEPEQLPAVEDARGREARKSIRVQSDVRAGLQGNGHTYP